MPHFDGVEITTSSALNAKRSHRALSAMKPRYRRIVGLYVSAILHAVLVSAEVDPAIAEEATWRRTSFVAGTGAADRTGAVRPSP